MSFRFTLAQASLKQAEAQLRLAEVNLRKAQTLRARNVASEMQEVDMEAQRDIAAAKTEEARASVQLADVALSQVKPISDIISRPFIRKGAYVTSPERRAIRAGSPPSSNWTQSKWSARLPPRCTSNAAMS